MPALSEGLEGRSNNPVALLFDSLFHPDADFGADIPSVLEWNYQPQNEIPHVILGKTKPGGTWQVKNHVTLFQSTLNICLSLSQVMAKNNFV